MSPRRRPIEAPTGGFSRIAVLRLSSLGDVILATAAARAIHAAFPTARVEFWTREEFRDIVRFDPAVDRVRALEREGRRIEDLVSMSAELEDCDLIVDLHGNAATRLLTLRQKAPVLRAPAYRTRRLRWVHARWTRPTPAPPAGSRYAEALAPLGIATLEAPRVEAGAEAEAWADAHWTAWNPGRTVAICPGARHFTKRWPERHWLDLVERLRARGDTVLALSLESERRALPALAGRLAADSGGSWCTESLPRISALMTRCAAAISGDSGLMHLAAARGLRVVGMFGSTAPELGFAPAGEFHQVLCRHERCQPCTLHGRAACPKGHFRCMNELRPETTLEALDRVLAR